MPGYFHVHAARAAALGQLGQFEEARKAVQDLLVLRPDFAVAARQVYSKWYEPEEIEHLLDGLRKALCLEQNMTAGGKKKKILLEREPAALLAFQFRRLLD
jgi:tetratricopeptide (TPR) repeat protein